MIYIYAYENKLNGKVYIGQTHDLYRRNWKHVKYTDWTMPIDRAIHKYGTDNFDFWTITIVDTSDKANQEEIYWIAEMRKQLGHKNVYNILSGGQQSSLGLKRSEETKRKMVIAHTGKKASPQAKINMAMSKLGRHLSHSEETKIKISHANKGKKQSQESCAKRSAIMSGKHWQLVNGKRVWY